MKKIMISLAAVALVLNLVSLKVSANNSHSTPPASVTCNFSVSPSSIPLGTPTVVTLTWSTTGANYDGVLSPELGYLAQSGSTTYLVNGVSKSFTLVATSGSNLVDNTGSYALCKTVVSTTSHIPPP